MEPLGVVRVPTPGTPIQVITLKPVAQQAIKFPLHAFFFQPLPTNTGFVYIGVEGMDKTTFERCYAWIPIPTENSVQPFSGAHTISPNGMVINQFWVDADVAEDGVIVTIMVT